MNKLLILDKSAFHGTSCSELKMFVKNHRVILPYTLVVECGNSQKGNSSKNSKDPMRLIQKLSDVVKNGAFLGKSPAKIVEEEKPRNTAIESLVDMEQTQIVRRGELNYKLNLNELREKCDRALQPKIDFVKQWAKESYKTILEKNSEKDFRRKANELNLQGRLREWLLSVDSERDNILNKLYGNERDEMSVDRWEWQMLRLCLAWGSELAGKRNNSGPSYKIDDIDISNDIYDIYYVSHLSQADGLVAGDRNLVQPLAMAAFPDKDVFGNIDEVPKCYRIRKMSIRSSLSGLGASIAMGCFFLSMFVFPAIITIVEVVLIALKLFSYINWTWGWVIFAPLLLEVIPLLFMGFGFLLLVLTPKEIDTVGGN